MATTRKRSTSDVSFIGAVREKFREVKLPSNLEVMQVFFYQHKCLNKTVKASAWHTAREVIPFWTVKCRIPVIKEVHVFEKVQCLFHEWILVKKNHTRKTGAQLKRESEFKEKMGHLFDIAVTNALDLMQGDEDKQFLVSQRLPGRQGVISSAKDRNLALKEKEIAAKKARTEERTQQELRYKQNYELEHENQGAVLEWEYSSSDDDNDKISPAGKRKTRNVLTPELAVACDAFGLSSRGASEIIAVTAHSLGHKVEDLNVNRSSLHRGREKLRSMTTQKFKDDFSPDPQLTLHWDGKIVPDLVGKDSVDRIAVVATGVTTEKVLSVPKISSGTGKATAEVVFEAAQEWGIISLVKALSFDTTAVNTGLINGAIVFLEELLSHKTLNLACRHHIFELLLEAVYCHHLKPSGGPDYALFKRFQQAWPGIDKTQYSIGNSDDDVKNAIGNEFEGIISFAKEQIQVNQPRDDYFELLNLAIIFAGGDAPKGFMAPGAFHKARWMNKAIYALKIWMFRRQFKLSKQEERGLRRVNIFIVSIYLKYWFRSPDAIGAPKNDIDLISDLIKFKEVDLSAASIALQKLSGHLWYLSEVLVSFALFDERIPPNLQTKFVQNMRTQGDPDPPSRRPISAEDCNNLESLFTTNSRRFFDILGLTCQFLDDDPVTWRNNEEYLQARKVVRHLRVVNDHAERAVKLMQTFNRRVTTKEKSFQDLLQVSSRFQSVMKKGSKKPTSQQIDSLSATK